MKPLQLVRHFTANPRAGSVAEHRDACREEVATGHPAVPPANALSVLRYEACGRRDLDDGRLIWHHADNSAWAAVDTLHRNGRHDAACALARLLHWCDQHGSHNDYTQWELR